MRSDTRNNSEAAAKVQKINEVVAKFKNQLHLLEKELDNLAKLYVRELEQAKKKEIRKQLGLKER